jgi:predicted dehydrogenase
MTGGAHFYFYHHYADPRQISVPTISGFKVTKVWDEHRAAAEALSDVLDSRPTVCDSFEQVHEDVDLVFIGDCNGDGSDHVLHASPGLKKGVATYIDKPLANDVADVRKLLSLSRKHNAPIFSASILRHVPGAAQFAGRMSEIGGANSGCVRGGGCHIAGQIHTVSLAQAVFGAGITEVHAMGPGEQGVMHLSWGDRKDRPAAGVVIHHNVTQQWHCSVHVSAYGPDGAILAHNNINDYFFPRGAANILKLVKKMVRTGKVDDSFNDMIEAVAVVNAGRESYRSGGKAVKVKKIV